MQNFEPVKSTRVADIIIDQIQAMIAKGILKAGEKLLSERKLCEQLNVSRASVREAISIMKDSGIVETYRGNGTIICDIFKKRISDPLENIIKNSGELTLDITEMRNILDVKATRLAAKRRTNADIVQIEIAYKNLVDASNNKDVRLMIETDAAFHLSIAEATHNIVLLYSMRSMIELIEHSIYEHMNYLENMPEGFKDNAKEHEAIYLAVVNGDADAAELASENHLKHFTEYLKNRA